MEVTPLPRWKSALHCTACGVHAIADEYPSEINDPFSQDFPTATLNAYQAWKLMGIWRGNNFGKRYHHGTWSKCDVPLRETIREWHKTQDCGLLISGSMGSGKTVAMGMMMACLAARNEFSFSVWNMSSLLTFLHNWRGWGERFSDDDQLKALNRCQYLFLDDLGVEYNSPMAMSRFNEIIERRYSNELFVVGTSNLTEQALMEREGWPRIIDRIQENVLDWCELGGVSKRRVVES
jgi:hypothetical protein